MSVLDVPITPIFVGYDAEELAVLQAHLNVCRSVQASSLVACGTRHHFAAAEVCERLAQRGLATVQLVGPQDLKETLTVTEENREDHVVNQVLAGPYEVQGPFNRRRVTFVKSCFLPGVWFYLTEAGVAETDRLILEGYLHRSASP